MKDGVKFLAGLGLAVLLLWLVLRGVDSTTVWESVKKASFMGLAVAAILTIGHNVFRVWRWQALLDPVRRGIAFRPMFVAVILGYMTTWIIPGRLGELVRPTLLSARERLPLGPCLGSVLADRLLDGGALVVLFVAGLWLSPPQGEAAEFVAVVRNASLAFVGAMAAFIAVLLTASAYQEPLARWIERRRGAARWVGRLFLSFSAGVAALRSPRLLIRIVVLSLLAWLTIALATWIGVRSVGAEISFPAMLVILPMLALGVAVPTPGGAGSYHGAMKLGLMLFGVGEAVAVSAGILMHLVITIPVILLGVVLIWTEGLSWNDIVSAARQLRQLGSDAGDSPPTAMPVEDSS
jgi:uncharacterized protein (TIRG00374 family)